VEPAVGDVDNAYLYNIDDLEQIIAQNMDARHKELERCTAIVDHEVDEFVEWLRTEQAVPTIQELVDTVNQMKLAELERLRPKLNGVSDADWQLIVQMADRLTNKVTHHPAATLREQAMQGEHWYTQVARKLFGLGGGEETEQPGD